MTKSAAYSGVKSMQKILISLMAIVLLVTVVNAQEASQEIRIATENGLPAFLSLIPPQERSGYGFTRDDDLKKAYLGDPFILHTIAPQVLLSYQPGDAVQAVLSKTTQWYFPVMLGQELRAILVVDQMDGKWKAVSLGYVPLAKQLQRVLEKYPSAKGFHPILIAVFQAKEYFLLVPEENANNLISLRPQNPDLAGGSAGNILEKLKPIVAENLKQEFSR
jgi:hypothetical protein